MAQEGIRDYLEGAAILNRRSFLSLLAGAGAASATSYFFAPIGGWKSDVIVHPRRVEFEALNPWVRQIGEDQYVSGHGTPYWMSIEDGEYMGISRS